MISGHQRLLQVSMICFSSISVHAAGKLLFILNIILEATTDVLTVGLELVEILSVFFSCI